MTFEELLAQVLAVLQREGRVSYRALKRRFNLADDDLVDLQDELIAAKQWARDEDGKVLVWTGGPTAPHPTTHSTPSQIPANTSHGQGAQPAPTSTAPHVPEAERRRLTVLCCDSGCLVQCCSCSIAKTARCPFRKSCASASWERRAPARLQKPRWSVAIPGKTLENWQWVCETDF
jgi:hypothetical protein